MVMRMSTKELTQNTMDASAARLDLRRLFVRRLHLNCYNLTAACLLLLAAVDSVPTVFALDNGAARTPPMGWMAGKRFNCQMDCINYPNDCVNSALFTQQAERLIHDNYIEFGYKYVIMDDCWSEMRREHNLTGRLIANKTLYPAGLSSLANQLNELGLILGAYGNCGIKTRSGYPGQLHSNDIQSTSDLNHFKIDASTLVDWHIGAFKFDTCHIDPLKAGKVCSQFSADLNKKAPNNRPVMLMCNWPVYMMYAHEEPDWRLIEGACNVWRYYDQIEDSWASILNTLDHTVKHQAKIVQHHGPGHWFDPGQLTIGNFGLSAGQQRVQMALWCIWAAPLFMDNDLRSIGPHSASLLKNSKLIQVNQDKLGVFGQMVAQYLEIKENRTKPIEQAFVKPIEPIKNGCPSFAIVYLNRATAGNKRRVSFKLRDLLVAAPIRAAAKNQASTVRADQQQQAADESTKIQSNECLLRLDATSSSNNGAASSQSTAADPIKYEITDLFDDGAAGIVSTNDQLELDVEPNSVRAIKLSEL